MKYWKCIECLLASFYIFFPISSFVYEENMYFTVDSDSLAIYIIYTTNYTNMLVYFTFCTEGPIKVQTSQIHMYI